MNHFHYYYRKAYIIIAFIFIICSCHLSEPENPVGRISLESPALHEEIYDTSPVLIWGRNTRAAVYELIMADNSGLSSPIIHEAALTDYMYELSGENEELCSNNTTYYWKVRAQDNDGTWGAWSLLWDFDVYIQVPGVPYPPDASTVYSTTPYLNWDDIPGAAAYNLQVYETPDFSGNVVAYETGLLESSYQMETALVPGTTYYWRAQAENEDGVPGEWSEGWSFSLFEFTSGVELTETTGGVVFHLRGIEAGDYTVESNPPGNDAVTLTSHFWVSGTEVTYELWYEVAGWAATHDYFFANPGREGNDGIDGAAPTSAGDEPVTNISWRDAVVWCNALSEKQGFTPVYTYDNSVLRDSRDENGTQCDAVVFDYSGQGYRLPTGVEWEIAARGGNPGISGGTYDTLYAGSNTMGDVAWYVDNSGDVTHQVGTRDPNELFIHDLSGNAFEFCWDWFEGSYPSTVIDPVGEAVVQEQRMLRGGAYNSDTTYTVMVRYGINPDIENYYIGFRIARNLN
jgi:formylglycine-generating enzyme